MRLVKIILITMLVVFAANSASFAEAKLVPQIGWPGTCEDQAWSDDGRTAIGLFINPVPAIVKWDAKSWDVISYQPLTDLADPELIKYGTLSPDGRYLVVNINDEEIRVIDTASNSMIMRLPNAQAGFAQKQGMLIEIQPKTVRLWDIAKRDTFQSFSIGNTEISNAQVSPNGKLLFTIDHKGKGVLWDVRTGKVLRKLNHNAPLLGPITFSPDSKYLVTDGDDPKWKPPGGDYPATEAAYARTYELLLWDTRTGKRLLRRPDHYSLDGGTDAFFFIENGSKLMSCSTQSIDVWSIPAGKHIRSFEKDWGFISGPFALSPDGKILAAGPERWSLPSFKLTASIPMYNPAANWLAFSPDGSKLAAITSGDIVAVWDMSQLRVIRSITPSSWSSDTRVMFTAEDEIVLYNYANNISLYSAVTGKLLRDIKPPIKPESRNYWTRISPNGKLLAGDVTEGDSTHLEVWDAETLSSLASITPSPTLIRESAFSSDGRWLIVGDDEDDVTLYDLKANTSRKLPGFMGQYTFSPDGSLIASYKRKSEKSLDLSVVLMDTVKGEIHSTLGDADVRYNRPTAFSPDGKRVAAVSGSHINIYQIETGKPVLDLAEVGAVRQIAFSPDGRWIAGTSGLGVTLWDAATGKVATTLIAVPPDRETGKGGFWISIKPDGSYNASAGAESHLRRVDGESVRPVSQP